MAWFDPTELEASPLPPPVVARAAAVEWALAQADSLTQERRHEREILAEQAEGPSDLRRWILVRLGLPTEAPGQELYRRPPATYTIAALLVLGFLLSLRSFEAAIGRLGFIPGEPFRLAGMTVLTSFFLHGGMLHLAGNLYFLVVFGDDVEEELGTARFVALLVAATVVGNLLYPSLALYGDIPHVGASGGIAGLIAYYGIRFPRRTIYWNPFSRLIGFMRRSQPLLLPAAVYVVAWLALQAIGAGLELEGFGPVAHLAHLGGAAVGAAVAGWRVLRPKGP